MSKKDTPSLCCLTLFFFFLLFPAIKHELLQRRHFPVRTLILSNNAKSSIMKKLGNLMVFTMAVLFVFMSACKDDDKTPGPQKIDGLNCARYVSFDVETISSISPDDSEGITNYNQLDVAEQLMLTPTSVKCNVESCIYPDGTFEGSVQLLPNSGIYEYSENTAGVGVNTKPLFHRAEISRDGSITYFDENGGVVGSGFTDAETIALYSMMLNMSRVTDTLSKANFELVLQAFANAGYAVDSLPDQNLISIDQNLQEGFSRVFFDTHRYAMVGQEDYDETGNFLQGYRLFLSGGFNDFKVVGHEFRTSFQSPFSNVKMNIYRRSLITNFVMQ